MQSDNMQDLSSTLRQILDDRGLTIYGASQIVGAETDEPIKRVHDRITRYLKEPPKTWVDLTNTLDALGYRIKIEKIEN